MGTSDRQPYLTATTLDQAFLDECFDGLTTNLELVVDIEAPIPAPYTNPSGTLVEVTWRSHGFDAGDELVVITSPFGADYTTYTLTTATTDTLQFDAGAPPGASGSLTFVGLLRLSDRNKYVGPTFYEARLVFPTIIRTIGELLSPELQFSDITLEVNNADSRFNSILPAGDDFAGWIGRRIVVRMGLRDVEATYQPIFSGRVTPEAGFQRTVKSFILTARNDFEKLNVEFPRAVFTRAVYPDLDADLENVIVPVIYGDWMVAVEPDMASIRAFIVNGADPNVTGDGSPHSTRAQLVIADHALTLFDAASVYVKRGALVTVFDIGDVDNINVDNSSFELRQVGTAPAATTLVDGATFAFERGDEIYVKVKGKDLAGLDDNIIAQARDILETYAGAVAGDFDANWTTYRDKAAPAQSAIANFAARIWLQEPKPVLTFVLSLLEQVRLEAFVSRAGTLKLSSLHFEEFNATPTFKVKNWDVAADTFKPKLDERTNFNRAQGVFNFLPNRNENFQSTKILRNDAAITQADGIAISKKVVYPNLYDEAVVTYQVGELLRLCSAYLDNVYCTLTWRAMLLDIGDFVALDVDIQGTRFESVPALIREIGYDPEGIKVPIRFFSTQMMPFPGWGPSSSGITGGYSATITEE